METIVLLLELGLALIFLYFGFLKLFLPIEKIAKKVSWAHDYPDARIKLFGLLEVLGAIGLVVPHQLGFMPILTPMAATGLAMLMSGAIAVHLKRDEVGMIVINLILIFLLAGVGFNSLIEVLGEKI